jgi:hypothetical protein
VRDLDLESGLFRGRGIQTDRVFAGDATRVDALAQSAEDRVTNDALERAVEFQPQVIVKPLRGMLLDHIPAPGSRRASTARLRRDAEVTLPAIAGKWIPFGHAAVVR